MRCRALEERVNFGGEWVPVGRLYAELGDARAGIWLAGYAQRCASLRAEAVRLFPLDLEARLDYLDRCGVWEA